MDFSDNTNIIVAVAKGLGLLLTTGAFVILLIFISEEWLNKK